LNWKDKCLWSCRPSLKSGN